MTDAPKPPRPAGFPPPLPGSLQGEPFLPAVDEEPPPPTRRDRPNSTPPSGSLMLSQLVDRLSTDPKDVLIEQQRQTIKLYQQRVVELQGTTKPSPVPSAPKSTGVASLRTMTKREIAKVSGKWGGIIILLLPAVGIAGRAIARKHPEYQQLIDQILDSIGL